MATQLADDLAFDERGNGPAVVLIHGFPLDRRVWSGVLFAAEPDLRVATVDLPGFGRSPSKGPLSLEGMADAVAGFARDRRMERIVLAGLSMGGYVALAFAERHADLLAGLALVDSKAEADTAEARANRDRMIEVAHSKGSDAIADLMLPKMLAPHRLTAGDETVAELVRIMRDCPAATIANALAAMRDRPDRSAVVAGLGVPLLAVCGEHDPLTPPAVMKAIADSAGRGEFVEVRDAGHMAPLECPQPVAKSICGFARRCFG